ncbi:hypothetical protein N658DRAFT_487787 [Parathielavia hyrcaniae]|uniref:Uncharacterized protein n=1 Tax=Parathielavia hyrcaniae TaxID=113614 RepID=A0AAN6SZI1_9PEZI|nr:hypothetical protein N658DRAFT_487787 [Parathielavia hyrcaniae]
MAEAIGDDPASPYSRPGAAADTGLEPCSRRSQLENGEDDDSTSDESSEGGLFVRQDPEIKDENDNIAEEGVNDSEDQSLPDNIKSKFASFKFGGFPHGAGDVICLGSIKVEDQDADLSLIRDADNEADSDFEMDEDDILSDGEPPRPRRRRGVKRQRTQRDDAPQTDDWQEPTEEELTELFTKQEELNVLKSTCLLDLAERWLSRKSPRRSQLSKSGRSKSRLRRHRKPKKGQMTMMKTARLTQKSSKYSTPRSGVHRPRCQTTDATLALPGADEPLQEQAGKGKTSRPKPKSAKEYWEREYAEKGSGLRDITGDQKKRKRPVGQQNKRKKGFQSHHGESRTGRHGHAWRAIQATTQRDQYKAMKHLQFKINGNPKSRFRLPDEKILREAVTSFGLKQCREFNGRWKLKGIESALFSHQIVGVSWMLRQEFSPDGPHGGILADQMGLGKTTGRPLSTLIVAPAIVIDQWEKEIKKHCDKSFIKLTHHYKASQGLNPEMWQQADIILASYYEVANAYPSEKALKRIVDRKLNNEEWGEELEEELGELFGHEFFRVVLDEGHMIRTDGSKTSQACIHLTSKYRWILTGTPLHNRIDEFYPYFRFLGAHWAEDRNKFAKQFGNIKKDDALARLGRVVRSVMLRRLVNDQFMGVPILEIPRAHPTKIIYVDLTTEERLIYRRLEIRFRDNMSSHIKAGIAHTKLTTYLAYLTRLRQAVVHPFLLEGVLKDKFTLEDFDYLRKKLATIGGKTPMHRQLAHWLQLEYEVDMGGDGEEESFGKGRFGYHFDMDEQLKELEATNRFAQPCKTLLFFSTDALQQPEGGPGEQSDAEGGKKRSRRKTKKNKEHPEVGDDLNWTQPKLRDSSKWISTKNQILIWQREAPGDKIIATTQVFVNWAKLACIIGRMLSEEEIPFLYYFGDQTKEEKAAAIADFRERPEPKVLVYASIRCGGQALNLTCANRVILVDQWWNTALENQAFGRVHRIGQEKETYFVKIVVRDTIDEGLLQMQERKARMIAKALPENGKATEPTLDSVEELRRLFSMCVDEHEGEDEPGEGAVIVLSDDDDEDEGQGEGEGENKGETGQKA